MQYDELRYVPESQDPSLTIETKQLVARIIDNTGLEREPISGCKPYFGRYGTGQHLPFVHHLGYHGIRALWDKVEKRNLVVPFVSWLNLQGVSLAGIATDPADERSAHGVGRGWPIRMEPKGRGALLTIAPQPNTRFQYTLEIQPAEPDGLHFSIQFVFHARPPAGPSRARFSWPCYMNAYDDVRFHYPGTSASGGIEWTTLGEPPDIVLGEPVGYVHEQKKFLAEAQAAPVGFGRIGSRMLTIMFSDPKVRFFVVNAGGHYSFSSVQNPAWDFEYVIDNYPLDTPVGFHGRLIYGASVSPQQTLERYSQWAAERRGKP